MSCPWRFLRSRVIAMCTSFLHYSWHGPYLWPIGNSDLTWPNLSSSTFYSFTIHFPLYNYIFQLWTFEYPFGFRPGVFRYRVFGVIDFSSIRIFLNFGVGLVQIFADLVRVRITHLNYFKILKLIIYFKFFKIYKQNNILHINLNNICQNT